MLSDKILGYGDDFFNMFFSEIGLGKYVFWVIFVDLEFIVIGGFICYFVFVFLSSELILF